MIEPLIRATANVSNLISRLEVEPLDRADQPEQAVRDQVGLLDVGGQAARHPAGDELHERRVGEHERLAGLLVPVLLVAGPGLLEVCCRTRVSIQGERYARGWLRLYWRRSRRGLYPSVDLGRRDAGCGPAAPGSRAGRRRPRAGGWRRNGAARAEKRPRTGPRCAATAAGGGARPRATGGGRASRQEQRGLRRSLRASGQGRAPRGRDSARAPAGPAPRPARSGSSSPCRSRAAPRRRSRGRRRRGSRPPRSAGRTSRSARASRGRAVSSGVRAGMRSSSAVTSSVRSSLGSGALAAGVGDEVGGVLATAHRVRPCTGRTLGSPRACAQPSAADRARPPSRAGPAEVRGVAAQQRGSRRRPGAAPARRPSARAPRGRRRRRGASSPPCPVWPGSRRTASAPIARRRQVSCSTAVSTMGAGCRVSSSTSIRAGSRRIPC